MGVIPTLVKLLAVHSHNTALTEMCLVAFGNLAELGKFSVLPSQQRSIQRVEPHWESFYVYIV